MFTGLGEYYCICGKKCVALEEAACNLINCLQWCHSVAKCIVGNVDTRFWKTEENQNLPPPTLTTTIFFVPHLNATLCCSPWAVSRFASLNGETVAAGVVSCLIVYPLYLLVFTLFRMSRSKVTRTCPSLPVSIASHMLSMSLIIFSLCACVCVWTSVCVCGAGATTSWPGVGGDWWLPGQLHGWKFLPLL